MTWMVRLTRIKIVSRTFWKIYIRMDKCFYHATLC